MNTSDCTLVPNDGGPIYGETNMCRNLVEPWNTFSLILFFIIAGYWLRQHYRSGRTNWLIELAILLLFVGGIGGSIYHACRCAKIWLLLDVVPIALLVFCAAFWFWSKLLDASAKMFRWSACVVLVGLGALCTALNSAGLQGRITLSYAVFALILLVPAFALAKVTSLLSSKDLCLATVLFAIAIVFRILDWSPVTAQYFSHGTHFLWHIFGALSAHYLIRTVDACQIGSAGKR